MSETTDTNGRQIPTIDSEVGPCYCPGCDTVYTKFGDANRGVCSDCWSDSHTCPECGGVKETIDDTCDDCACDHPAAYVDTTGSWDVHRCVECEETVNRGRNDWWDDRENHAGYVPLKN